MIPYKERYLMSETNHFIEGTKERFMMKAGRYWIGDLCYVQNVMQRVDFLAVMFGSKFIEHMSKGDMSIALKSIDNEAYHPQGKFFMMPGFELGQFTTAYGDDVYSAGDLDFPVDSGSIGIIPAEHVHKDGKAELGHIIEFPEEFECWYDEQGGMWEHKDLHFGHLTIKMGLDAEEDEEEDEDELMTCSSVSGVVADN
jgi:hypothetical protein